MAVATVERRREGRVAATRHAALAAPDLLDRACSLISTSCREEPTLLSTATDLTLILPDRVGSLAEAMDVFRRARINIRGHGGFPAWAGEGVLHLLLDDPDRAMAALREAGIEVREERVVLTVRVSDEPGAFADVLDRIAGVGVNVDLTYLTTSGEIVVGVNDIERARRALGLPEPSATTERRAADPPVSQRTA
ncbi:MAG TPA: hypothetical protein VK992_00420 [Candidatus Caenarcaniphilales bacterium]|nr:hypothetical protein [Candidatus Caenarcaniphilales bacterium]